MKILKITVETLEANFDKTLLKPNLSNDLHQSANLKRGIIF